MLLIGGLGLIQFLSWAVGNVITTLAGIIVLLGALILGAGLFTQVLSLPLWFVTAAELFKPWTAVDVLYKTTA